MRTRILFVALLTIALVLLVAAGPAVATPSAPLTEPGSIAGWGLGYFLTAPAGYDFVAIAVFSNTGHFTDKPSTSWTATVDYGDGSGVQPLALQANKSFSLKHTYADNGIYNVTVQVTDEAGTAGTAGMQVTVKNLAPKVSAGRDANLKGTNGAVTFSHAGSFTDLGADTWTAIVDYGDHTGFQTLTLNADKTFSLSHAFAKRGIYKVTVKVVDDDGGVGIDTVMVWVR